MKKILIEKTKDKKKKRKNKGEGKVIWKITAIAVSVCILLFAVILVGMDYVMRSLAPDLYMGTRLLNTYKIIEKENSQKNDFFKGSVLPDGNTGINVSGEFEKIRFELGGNYNTNTKKTFLGGTVNTAVGEYNTELFYENGISGICLPDFLNVWLCSADSSVFEDMKNSGISNKLAIPYIPSVYMPDASKLNMQNLYPLVKELADGIRISNYTKRANGLSQYDVTVSGSAVKNVLVKLCEDIWKQGIFGENENNLLKGYVADIAFPETAVFTLYERKKAVVYASAQLEADGEVLELLIDMSQKARLSDGIQIKAVHKMEGSSFGITYSSSGDHSNPNGQISDNTEIALMLPFIDNITFNRDVKFDSKDRFTYHINIKNGENADISLAGSGIYTDMEFHANADEISAKFKDAVYSGSGSVGFMVSKEEFKIPEREKFELKSIPKETLSRLITGIGMFLDK